MKKILSCEFEILDWFSARRSPPSKNQIHTYMKTVLQDIKDLLSFEIKHSKRHGLDRVSITVPRATLLIKEINEKLKAAR